MNQDYSKVVGGFIVTPLDDAGPKATSGLFFFKKKHPLCYESLEHFLWLKISIIECVAIIKASPANLKKVA